MQIEVFVQILLAFSAAVPRFTSRRLNAGHQVGDKFEIRRHNPAGLCGFFYHDIFPNLCTFQSGGSLPWSQGDTIHLECPGHRNQVTLKLERAKRE